MRQGACAARNKGISVSSGEYIAFQDSDDEWDKEKLRLQMNAFDENVDCVFCNAYRVFEGKGYGTKILKLTLEEAKKINLSKVWLGAYESNVGSWKLMEKCGATFYKIVYEEDTNLPIKKYWIDI